MESQDFLVISTLKKEEISESSLKMATLLLVIFAGSFFSFPAMARGPGGKHQDNGDLRSLCEVKPSQIQTRLFINEVNMC